MKVLGCIVVLAFFFVSVKSHAQFNGTTFFDKIFPKSPVSMKNTADPCFVRAYNMLPRGSALITASGELKKVGISAIIHAATGAMSKTGGVFEPNEESVVNSIMNSMRLARKFRHSRVAVPFIGGGIFADRIGLSKQQLAKVVIDASQEFRDKIEVVFVIYNYEEYKIFSEAISHITGPEKMTVLQGSITDFHLHKASAIVNSANMEIIFGNGVSGVIGKATGEVGVINQKAADLISAIGNDCKTYY